MTRWLLALVIAIAACAGSDDSDVALADAVSRAPEMEPADLYKLLHQGWMGPAHAAPPLGAARAFLASERESMARAVAPVTLTPTIEPLPGPHGLVRVHLAAWPVARDSALAAAFIETAKRVRPDTAGLHRALRALSPAALKLRFDSAAWNAYVDARQAEGFAAVHHSPSYEGRYRPAYRVVLRDVIQ